MTEEEKNIKLTELRSENARVLDAQKIIAHMSIICDTTDDTLTYMDRNAKLIQNVSDHFTIPYYNEMFDDFSDYQKGGCYSLDIEKINKACKTKIDLIGKALDIKKSELANDIEEVKNTVTNN